MINKNFGICSTKDDCNEIWIDTKNKKKIIRKCNMMNQLKSKHEINLENIAVNLVSGKRIIPWVQSL